PDHYNYTAGDMERISKSVRDRRAELVMTTEKDFARMDGKFNFPVDIIVVGVKMCIKDENSFKEFILGKL
ncbi:MAG: tetraacyldisaccharide 4'-kinase, partial [Desulfobacterales bacterium]|nr:tetraacyldisaccharide 4'-kinase [Desulfobacterales bacterium]